jgi:hypothetical protein
MPTVTIGRFKYTPPTRGDHLMKVPRTDLPLSAQDEFRKPKDDEELVEALVKYGYTDGRIPVVSGIVCDACNAPILYPYVWVLVISNPWRVWGVLCEDCKAKYHKGKPAYIGGKIRGGKIIA